MLRLVHRSGVRSHVQHFFGLRGVPGSSSRNLESNAHSCSLNKFNSKLESLNFDNKVQCEHLILTGSLSIHL